jgi:hypothetical protein
MVCDLIGLVFLALVAAAILRFVPRRASRAWATGLLVFAVFGNFGALLGAVAAYVSPPILYLDTEKNQLRFNRGEKGELFGVQVNNPPEECRAFRNDRPWSMAAGNLALAAVVLVFLRRASAGVPDPSPEGQDRGGTP